MSRTRMITSMMNWKDLARRGARFVSSVKKGQTEVLQYHENGNSDREESTIVGYRVHLL